MPDDIPDGYVAVARVLGASGVRGEVKVEALANETLLSPGRAVTLGRRQTTIEHATRSGAHVRLKLEGIESREEAAAQRGAWVLAPEDSLPSLPDGEFYRFQLLGLRVVSTEGADIGTIEDIFSTPENDVYVVRGPAGQALIPAVEDIVTSIDLERRLVTVEVVPGLLPDS